MSNTTGELHNVTTPITGVNGNKKENTNEELCFEVRQWQRI